MLPPKCSALSLNLGQLAHLASLQIPPLLAATAQRQIQIAPFFTNTRITCLLRTSASVETAMPLPTAHAATKRRPPVQLLPPAPLTPARYSKAADARMMSTVLEVACAHALHKESKPTSLRCHSPPATASPSRRMGWMLISASAAQALNRLHFQLQSVPLQALNFLSRLALAQATMFATAHTRAKP